MPQAKLSLPDHARTKIWNRLVTFIFADPTMARMFAPTSRYTWDGNSDSARAMATGNMPAIRLTPYSVGADPITPVRMKVPFGIRVSSFIIDDLFNLWGAFELALFPGDGSNALLSAMQAQDVWPETYDIKLDQPAISPKVDEANQEYLAAVGTINILILLHK